MIAVSAGFVAIRATGAAETAIKGWRASNLATP
jgi:hypothetical protein